MKPQKSAARTWTRGDNGFDSAVLATSFNAADPGRRPAVMMEATSTDDVIAAIKCARAEGLKVSLVSGGHSWAQNHIRDGALLLNLSRLNAIEIDEHNRVARIGPGVVSGDLNAALAKRNLFFPVAHAYTVGMGGFLLQGGFGWGSRHYGLGCENVIGIDAVLADGTLVHASETENADLFWAARGAGPGFFAAIVRFHLQLHARPKFCGLKLQVFHISHLEEVLSWADEIGPSVAPNVEFQMVFNRKAFGIRDFGIEVMAPVMAQSWRAAREAVSFISKSPVRKQASLTLPLVPMARSFMMKTGERTLFLPNTRWVADNMWMNGPIAPLLPALRRIADTQPAAPSHALWLNWNAPAQRKDMAFSMEGRTYLALYGGLRGKASAADQSWATDHMRALEQHSVGIQLADENLARRPWPFVSTANMKRLDQVRAAYDPDGLFHPWMGRAA